MEDKKITILGFSIWRIFAYFIIYSVIGFFVETLFGIATKGVWESRQSFLYGPICTIYGMGAVVMILSLQFFKKNNNRLFWGGFIVGSVVEYIVSLIGEMIFHAVWWDYSNMPLNLNGRICVFYSIFWGFLAIYLMTYLNPMIDRVIDATKKRFDYKKLKAVTLTVIVMLALDFMISSWAMDLFIIRMVAENDININRKQETIQAYNYIYKNENTKWLAKGIYTLWGDKIMLRTFPNLKIQDLDGNVIYIDSLLPDIKPYYYKFFDSKLDLPII